jgi:hypothetical protein
MTNIKRLIYSIVILFLVVAATTTGNIKIILANPGCYPPNEWTGTCDSGYACPAGSPMYGYCCDSTNECNNNPATPNNSTNDESSPLGGGGCSSNALNTAIGCIPIGQQEMITFLLRWAIGIAGGIAFILIIIASFQIMTSQGDPKRLQAGKELLSSAIMGLILLIFSAFILRVIGVNILKIPGLS